LQSRLFIVIGIGLDEGDRDLARAASGCPTNALP